jgi:NADPH2:quinone reductase
VGSAGIQVARALGAEVVGAVGSTEKLEHVRRAGATAVTYDELPTLDAFDVILDQVGGELFAAAIRALTPLGTIVGIGFAGGAWQPVDPALLVGRNASIAGFYLGRFMKLRPRAVQDAARELLERWAAGDVSPVVGATFPLAEADAALQLVADRRSTGKVVLLP